MNCRKADPSLRRDVLSRAVHLNDC